MTDDQPKLSAVDSDFVKGSVFSYAVVTALTKTLTFFYHIEPPSDLVLAWSVLINAACWFGGKIIVAWMRREKLLANGESGFTLIELMVVIGIMGILASFAIPQFNVYRARATDARTRSDLRNAVLAQNAYFAAEGKNYTGELEDLIKAGYRRSPGVEIRVQVEGGDFEIKAWASSGCAEGTGWWQYSTKGAITGLDCR